MSALREINPNVRMMKDLEIGVVLKRVALVREMLQKGQLPFKDLIDVSWGDPHTAGVKPITFVRQVLAACLYPQLIDSAKLPVDARQRAQRLLASCEGGSVGSYSATKGIPQIVSSVAEFISRRDGGVPSSVENIYISPGSQWCLSNILKLLINNQGSVQSGVLVPVPCYNVSIWSVVEMGGLSVPYYLNEEQGWEVQVEELNRAFESSKEICNPVALYIINPGNPTGHVQSRRSMQEVIRFVSEKKLFLLADEVYQDSIYGDKSQFLSYKKVLAEMGPPLSDTQELASFHSISKGFMGECGLRGGYVELTNVDPAVMKHVYQLFSKDSCAPVSGQIALDLMVNPPQPGDPSYSLYNKETQHIRNTLRHNVRRVEEVLNSLPGFSCQPVEGGAFAFPSLDLPPRAILRAQEEGMNPDSYYCVRLLEEAGVLTGPGCQYGQKEGTSHIRFCIMTRGDTMEEILRRISCFHLQFMKEFS
ncbi:alanine aminotransferase 2 [Neosynchiropus ocellatus]